MDSLHDHDGLLEVTLSDYINGQAIARFKVTFRSYPAYRNFDESCRLELWKRRDELTNDDLGWTFIISDSPWIRDFANEPVFVAFHPNAIHYVIATENDVIEVLSEEQPSVERLA